MNIGFDLDNVFVDYPPFIPDWVIDKLYKKKANGTLLYRIPGKLEQQIRILSHDPIFRPIIQKNLSFLKGLSKKNGNKLFLISSRFSFLRPRTDYLISKYNFKSLFSKMYFNYEDQQPHFFKSGVLSKEKIDRFVDDDLPLVRYLAKKYPQITFFWLNNTLNKKLSQNIYAITNLSRIIV